MANPLDLALVPLKPAELTSDQARATYTETVPAIPRGLTPVKKGVQTKKYWPLSMNPVAKSAIDSLIAAVYAAPWVIKSTLDVDANPQLKQLDDSIINLLNDCLSKLKYDTFDNVLFSLTYAAVTYGFAVAEEVWEQNESQLWVIRDIKSKPSFEYDINVDNTDTIQSLTHTASGVILNPEKFIVSTYPYLRDGNPYGLSELQAIEKDILMLEELEKQFTLGTSSIMNRSVLHYQDLVSRDINQVLSERTAIENVLTTGGGVIHLPASRNADTDELVRKNQLEVLESMADGGTLDALQNRIIELQKRINRNFGIQDNLGQTSVEVGSYAKSRTELDMFMMKSWRLGQWVRGMVNRQIVERIIQYNYDVLPPDYTIPIWDFQEIEENVLETKSDTVSTLYLNGIISVKEAREYLELPAIDESELIPQGGAPTNATGTDSNITG